MNFKDKSLVWLIILPIIFLSLHYFVFLGNYKSPFSGNESFPDWFMLVSSAPEPLALQEIVLDETIKPNYLNPFTFKYKYIHDNPKSIATFFEEHKFLFGSLKVKNNDLPFNEIIKKYPPTGDFKRGFTDQEYPNGLFFLIQYSLIIAFAFQVKKFSKSMKELK